MRLSEVISQLEKIKDAINDDPVVAIRISCDSNSTGFFPATYETSVARILGSKE